MPHTIITLDVRDDIRAGREPFARIMETVGRLRDGERIRVIAPFEPRPLIGVLAAQGFIATVAEMDDGACEVLFTPAAPIGPDDDLLLP